MIPAMPGMSKLGLASSDLKLEDRVWSLASRVRVIDHGVNRWTKDGNELKKWSREALNFHLHGLRRDALPIELLPHKAGNTKILQGQRFKLMPG